jgi:mRNA-degrading endonuclease RelE of RelBE toxin-antitoxin system
LAAEYSIDFADRAQVSYARLSNPVRKQVNELIDRIQSSGLRSVHARKIPDYPNMYLLRVTNDIRIILTKEDLVIMILDIVSREKLFGLGRL